MKRIFQIALIYTISAFQIAIFAQRIDKSFKDADFHIRFDSTKYCFSTKYSFSTKYQFNVDDFIYFAKTNKEGKFNDVNFSLYKNLNQQQLQQMDSVFRLKRDTVLTYLVNDSTLKEGKKNFKIQVSFGGSFYISKEQTNIDLTDSITSLIKNNTSSKPVELQITIYLPIKNTSKKTIYCTRELEAWHDNKHFRNNHRYKGDFFETIPPGKTYQMPIFLGMHSRYSFFCYGSFIIFSDDFCEINTLNVISKYEYD